FESVIKNIESNEKEDPYYDKIKFNLTRLAETLDSIMFLYRQACANISIDVAIFKFAVGQVMAANLFNYKSGMRINLSQFPGHIYAISTQVERKLRTGGTTGMPQAQAYIYDRMKEKGVDIGEFKKLLGQVKWSLYYGPSGLDEDYAGFQPTISKLNEMLDKADIPGALYYDNETGQISETQPEDGYKDEDTGEWVENVGEWYEVDVKDALFGEAAEYFAQGGGVGTDEELQKIIDGLTDEQLMLVNDHLSNDENTEPGEFVKTFVGYDIKKPDAEKIVNYYLGKFRRNPTFEIEKSIQGELKEGDTVQIDAMKLYQHALKTDEADKPTITNSGVAIDNINKDG
ncbi:MAG TPA: hypothetical protein VFV08_11075, partial [Puia sp.]|nr:hypothetical protein [Puia sp.]